MGIQSRNLQLFPTRFQAGFSVVELLVSLVISMAVIAGAIQIVASSKRSFLDQDEVTFIQNNARYALDLLSRDIRMAGYMGCSGQGSAQVANSIDDDAGGFVSMHGLQGFDGSAVNTFPAAYRNDATAGTDSIMVRRASGEGELDVNSHNPAAATIHLWGPHKYAVGSTLVIADASCRNVGLFQVSGPNNQPANHIVHNTGNATRNCTKIIKGDFVCEPTCRAVSCGGFGVATGGYGAGSKVMSFVSHAYYVGESSVIPGMPALKRRAFTANGPAGTRSEEIALGVEDMQLLYGVDTTGNGSVDQFRTAAQMDLNGDGTVSHQEWDQVLSVKISLVFRSQQPVMPQAQQKTLAGKEYNDRFLRQVVNSTVRVRNRG